MEAKRRSFKNQLEVDIKQAQVVIDRSSAAISRMKNSDMEGDYVRIQIEKLREKIAEKQEFIDESSRKVHLITRGDFDDEINTSYGADTKLQHEKSSETRRLKMKKREEKEANKSVSIAYYKAQKQDNRAHRQKYRDIRYFYKQYWKAVDSVPEYMQRKLKTLPNNEGFIWRGARLYGEKPVRRGSNPAHTIMRENRKGYTIIHETDERETRIYEQSSSTRNRQPKKLIQTIPRKKRKGTGSLMDYLAK